MVFARRNVRRCYSCCVCVCVVWFGYNFFVKVLSIKLLKLLDSSYFQGSFSLFVCLFVFILYFIFFLFFFSDCSTDGYEYGPL